MTISSKMNKTWNSYELPNMANFVVQNRFWPITHSFEDKSPFHVILSFFLRYSLFRPKWDFVTNSGKFFKSPEMLRFAVYGSYWVAKLFSALFVLLDMFNEKSFPSSYKLLNVAHFESSLRGIDWEKKSFRVISFWDSQFLDRNESFFFLFQQKCFKSLKSLD